MLQADSEKLRQAWIQAVQASIASAYRESPDSYYIEVSEGARKVLSVGSQSLGSGLLSCDMSSMAG